MVTRSIRIGSFDITAADHRVGPSPIVDGKECDHFTLWVSIGDDQIHGSAFGSVHDYENGRNPEDIAKELAAHEMSDILDALDDFSEFWVMAVGEEPVTAERAKELLSLNEFAERHADELEAIRDEVYDLAE